MTANPGHTRALDAASFSDAQAEDADLQHAIQMLAPLGGPRMILDVGAHQGGTWRRYRSAFPSTVMHCFEPFPESFSILESKTANDALASCHPLAMGENPGTRNFFVNHFEATNSLLPRPSEGRRYFPSSAGPKETIQVEVSTLDQFCEEKQIDYVDLLKLDIQGGELAALHGASRLLREGRVGLLYSEAMFVPHYESCPLFWEICAHLQPFGFSLFSLYHLKAAQNGQLRFGDALFVSSKIREQVIDRFSEEP